MKKKIILFILLICFVSVFAIEMKLKYSSINLNESSEVNELINFYKESIIKMQNKDGTVREKVDSLIKNLNENDKYRTLYLDWYVNLNYPKFYKEFFFINSRFQRPVNSGLYTNDDIFNYSIYQRKWIKPYFTKKITPTNVLPSLGEIRDKIWKSVIDIEPEFKLLNGSNTFNIWVVIKFISYDKINIANPHCPQLIRAKCLVIESLNPEMNGKTLNLTIIMSGYNKEFSIEQNYLVNYGYSFSPNTVKILDKPDAYVKQMKFGTQINMIFPLKTNGEIIYTKSTAKYYSDYHPLKGMNFKSYTDLFKKIKYLKNQLKTRSEMKN